MLASPILRHDAGLNQAAPGVNTNIMSSSLTPIYGSMFRVHVVLATSSVFNYTRTVSGTTVTVGLNTSVALQAGDAYEFDFSTTPTSAYNFQVETDGIIRELIVYEIPSVTS